MLHATPERGSGKPSRYVLENREVLCQMQSRYEINANTIHRFLAQTNLVISYAIDVHVIYDLEYDCSEDS